MTRYRYPNASLRADYLRAAGGFVLTAGLAGLAGGEAIPTAVLGACALLFLVFGIRTWRRHRIVVELVDGGISTSGSRCVTLRLRQLTAFKLRYYATRRDRTGGWMQLDLAAGRHRLVIESTLEGFSEVARMAALAADANRLQLDSATRNNLLALGVTFPAGAPSAPASSTEERRAPPAGPT